MDSHDTSVFIVIPNKNGREHLSYSLPSLNRTAYKNYKTILVDDGSTDDSLKYVADEFKEIVILKNQRKKGFAGTVNTGIKYALDAGASYIAVFNSDIQVAPEWINLALMAFQAEKRTGLVGFIEVPRERENIFFKSSIDVNSLVCKEVGRMAGCLYVCSSVIFHEIGLYDEDYFMYGEDNDLFARLSAAGFKLIETNVPVWHYGEGSSQKKKFSSTWLAYRNFIRFSLKNKNIRGNIWMFLSLINQGCNPFWRPPVGDPVYKRMRRYNPAVNVFLILGSCIWNLANIHSTLKARTTRM